MQLGSGTGLSNVLKSFGAIFMGFGFTFLVIGLLGVRYGARPALGTAATMALIGLVGGAIMFGGGTAMGKSSKVDN